MQPQYTTTFAGVGFVEVYGAGYTVGDAHVCCPIRADAGCDAPVNVFGVLYAGW